MFCNTWILTACFCAFSVTPGPAQTQMPVLNRVAFQNSNLEASANIILKNRAFAPFKALSPEKSDLSEMQLQALKKIEACSPGLRESAAFKNVVPDSFVRQLSERIRNPYGLNQGRTLYCWIVAPLAITYDRDPVGMCDAMIRLYSSGRFEYNNGNNLLCIAIPARLRDLVGSPLFTIQEDPLSRMFVDQMALMVFAENYKCWINIDRHFDPGDQMKATWASATMIKTGRVLSDLGYAPEMRGSSLLWPSRNKAKISKAALQQNDAVILFVCGPVLNEKFNKTSIYHSPLPFNTGSHYVLLQQIHDEHDGYKVTYWDDEGVQHYFLDKQVFRKAVYGLIAVKSNTKNNAASRANNENTKQ